MDSLPYAVSIFYHQIFKNLFSMHIPHKGTSNWNIGRIIFEINLVFLANYGNLSKIHTPPFRYINHGSDPNTRERRLPHSNNKF